MIKKEVANLIWKKVYKTWCYKYSKKNLNPDAVKYTKNAIYNFPHEDGKQRVKLEGNNKIYLAPISDIILNGLKGSEVTKYEEA